MSRVLVNSPPPAPRFLLHKAGRGFYRPNSAGYTEHMALAGRYHSWDASPEDGVRAIHEDNIPPSEIERHFLARIDGLERRLDRIRLAFIPALFIVTLALGWIAGLIVGGMGQ